MTKPIRAKAGTSKLAAADRHKAFVEAYLSNGRNATQAAITAGYSPKTAAVKGSQLLTDVKISALVEVRAAAVQEAAESATQLSVERTLKELARIAYLDPAKLFDAKGRMLSVHEMDADTRAALVSFETAEEIQGEGEKREVVGYIKKIRLADKVGALDKAMKHLGLFEKDNKQRIPVKVEVELLG